MHPQERGNIRVASPDRDHSALAALMSDYLRWALGQLESEYGISDMPVDPKQTARSLDAYRPPHGLAVIAEVDGGRLGSVHFASSTEVWSKSNGCTCTPIIATGTSD